MPMQSEAQRKWMWANHPEMAKRWEAETPKGKLPEHVKKKKVTGGKRKRHHGAAGRGNTRTTATRRGH